MVYVRATPMRAPSTALACRFAEVGSGGDRMWTHLSALYVAFSQSGCLTLHLIIKFSSYHCLNFENLIFASAIRAKSAHPAQQTGAFPASKHSG